MIKKFLYQLDQKNRKIITAVVEDDNESIFQEDKTFPLIEEKNAVINDDLITYVKGNLGYIVFKDNGILKYLDITVYQNEVKIALTENISYAACYNEEFFAVILDYVSYFDIDDCEFIYAGYFRNKTINEDKYESLFKKVKDSSYCKINKNNKAYFVSKNEDNTYSLTEDFTKAFKLNFKELRKILVINRFIDKKTQKSDLSFSSFKALSYNDGYIYAGLNPYSLSYIDCKFNISYSPSIPLDSKLINNEEVFLLLKDISYLLHKDKEEKNYFLEVDNKYIKKIDELKYTLVNNPIEATKIIDYDIEIIKSIYKVFNIKASIRRKNSSSYLYKNEFKYILSDKPSDKYNEGSLIDDKLYLNYINIFKNFKNNNEQGIILIYEDKYINLEILENNSFKINYLENSYNATILTKEQAKIIEELLNISFKQREIENLIKKDLSIYNIYYDNFDILKQYKSIMKEITSKKTSIVSYKYPSDLRCETEKASLEYLRLFYMKDVLDYKNLFELSLNDNIKEVLIISPKLYLELQGLSLATKSNINITILNENKFGFLPKVSLNDNINVKGMYRLKLSNLPKSFINKFDMIVFGKGFNEELGLFENTMNELLKENNNIIFLNTRISNLEKVNDPIYDYFSSKIDIKRKYFSYINNYEDEILKLDEEFINYLYSINRVNDLLSPVIKKEYSYHSILIKEGEKIKDFYSKN